jgi:hypothetical protein
MLSLQRFPERVTDCAGVRTAIEDRPNDFGLTRAGIAMLADVTVKPEGAVLLSFDQTFAFQKMNREDRGVATIAATKGQGAIFKVFECSNWTAADCDNLSRPANIGIAHADRPTEVVAPRLGLQIGKVRIPGDVNARRRIVRPGQKCAHLRLVTLK